MYRERRKISIIFKNDFINIIPNNNIARVEYKNIRNKMNDMLKTVVYKFILNLIIEYKLSKLKIIYLSMTMFILFIIALFYIMSDY